MTKINQRLKAGIITSQKTNYIGLSSGNLETDLEIGEPVAENLLKTFDRALKKCSADIKDLSEVYIDIGPGSFTGIRIGLAFIRMLKFIYRKLKIYPVSYPEVLQNYFNLSGPGRLEDSAEFYSIIPSYKDKYILMKAVKNKKNYSLLREEEVRSLFDSGKFPERTGLCGNFDFEIKNKKVIIQKRVLKGTDLIKCFCEDLRRPLKPLYYFSTDYKWKKKI